MAGLEDTFIETFEDTLPEDTLPEDTLSEDTLGDLEDSQQFDIVNVKIDLPDTEETQIVDELPNQREVALFTLVKAGRVCGAESTPFILPRRWTFDTLKKCVEDFVVRNNPNKTVEITQLYYKRARGKGVVKIDGDGDISALLKEYPLVYPSGKKKDKVLMYLAADIKETKLPDTPKQIPLNVTSYGPRRSPRLNKKDMDVFLYKVVDGKISSSSSIIHDVSTKATIKELTDLIRGQSCDDAIFIPAKGMFWIRKSSKQLVALKTQQDFEAGKKEYGESNIRIACVTVKLDQSPSSATVQNRKRKLDMSQAGENELWNEMHVQLVRDLEKKGVLWRYGAKHLKLWTDMMIRGELSGVGEEPVWEKHLDQIVTPPKSRRNSSPSATSTTSTDKEQPAQSRVFEMFLMQNQQRMEAESRRTEMFQTTLLTLLSSNISQQNQMPNVYPKFGSPQPAVYATTPSCERQERALEQGKDIRQFTCNDCLNFLTVLGLSHLKDVFEANQMDGPLLYALVHPQLGEVMLESMKMSKSDQQILVKGIMDHLKIDGKFNEAHASH